MAFTVDEDKNVSSNSNRDPSLRAGLTRQEGMMLVDTVINGVGNTRESAIKQLQQHSPNTIKKLQGKGYL